MKKPQPPSQYFIESIVDEGKIFSIFLIDRRNNSVHIHSYGGMISNRRMPIRVEKSHEELYGKNEKDLISGLFKRYFPVSAVIKRIVKKRAGSKPVGLPGRPMRMIVRFNSDKGTQRAQRKARKTQR